MIIPSGVFALAQISAIFFERKYAGENSGEYHDMRAFA
jgi:hypothetical protein